jgi:hypothetical protein
MKATGEMKQKFMYVLMMAAVMFAFGTRAAAATPQTLFTSQVPGQTGQSDGANVNYELGNQFRSNTAGQVTAIRFWKDANERGTHTGNIWSANGALLASVKFTNESAAGWQQQILASPLSIAANTTYVVTVNTGDTFYVETEYGFSSAVINGNLSSIVGNNGLYGARGAFPTNSWHASNYFRDVVFVAGASSATAPTITTQPTSQTVTSGQSASFNVAATGTSPITYQWMKNGVMIGGATSSTYTTAAETVTDNNAAFTVMVGNGAGSVTSNAAVLSVNAGAVAPSITSQPVSRTVSAGQTATFNVAATGTSPMAYQWMKNGAAIGGATTSTYTTPAETTSDNNAQFSVTVSNSAGNATSNAATLTVNSSVVAPTISSQPVSQSVIAGKPATFSVTASGTSPMTYQWSKNGAAIGGATSASYTTPAEITADNNAQFTVVATNSAGSATSNAATLTVNAATLLLNSSASSLSFGSVNISSTGSLTATFTNAGNSNITISNVSISGAGFNTNGVSSGLILTPGQSTTMTATFTPSAAGSATGSVTVASNATNSPDSVTLSGTGVAVVNHSAMLTWTPSTSTVNGYNTYSSTVSGGPYTKLNSTPDAVTSYTDSTVKAGINYYYVVTAVNSGNVESAYSSEVSAMIP